MRVRWPGNSPAGRIYANKTDYESLVLSTSMFITGGAFFLLWRSARCACSLTTQLLSARSWAASSMHRAMQMDAQHCESALGESEPYSWK